MKELIPLLEKLSEKLGTTSSHLWEVMIKQAKISAVTDLIWLIIYVPLFVVGVIITIKNYHKWNEKANNVDSEVILNVFIGVSFFACLVLLICALCSIPSIISGFLNPEYWALDKIMTHLTSLKK